jgi:predicted nucleic acid-binding Zn ribbon protein
MSTRPQPKKVRIPDHKHCPVCGRSMPVDAEFCSDPCRAMNEERLRRERRARTITLVIYAIMMAVLLLFLLGPFMRPQAG